jgi:hypothetical protein
MKLRSRLRAPVCQRGFFCAVLVSVALGASTAVATAGETTLASKSLTFYSVGTSEQFLDHADDRARGEGNNPFGNFTDATKTVQPGGNGPYPGDQALFQLTVYRAANLKTKAGVAEFNCIYNFNKNGYCDVLVQIQGGTLIGAGAINFNSTKFTLSISGGSGKFNGASGVMVETPAPNHSQRLAFVLS